jgi:hypothetical protein
MARQRSHTISLVLLITGVFLAASCSGAGTDAGKELAPLVGTWRAQELVLTNKANPAQSFDLIEEGGEFNLSILASGQYVATLRAFGQPAAEMGRISVSGNRFTITPTSHDGSPTSGTWRFQGEILVLDGDTQFDFNQDGTAQAATVHFKLFRHAS